MPGSRVRLRESREILRDVDVHLVPVEISVEAVCDLLPELEALAGNHNDLERHEAAGVKRGLAVEEHPIAVAQAPMNDAVGLQELPHEREVAVVHGVLLPVAERDALYEGAMVLALDGTPAP